MDIVRSMIVQPSGTETKGLRIALYSESFDCVEDIMKNECIRAINTHGSHFTYLAPSEEDVISCDSVKIGIFEYLILIARVAPDKYNLFVSSTSYNIDDIFNHQNALCAMILKNNQDWECGCHILPVVKCIRCKKEGCCIKSTIYVMKPLYTIEWICDGCLGSTDSSEIYIYGCLWRGKNCMVNCVGMNEESCRVCNNCSTERDSTKNETLRLFSFLFPVELIYEIIVYL